MNSHNISPNDPQIIQLQDSLAHWYNVEADFYGQRGKEDDMLVGERNTNYFHHKMNFRKRRTQIDTLPDSTYIWLTERNDIANCLKAHFVSMSRTSKPPPANNYHDFISPCISDDDNAMLIAMPTSDEIKSVIFDMKPCTTPGPDGFSPDFYQIMWDTVGVDIVKVVQSFFHSGHILKQMNHNFITLIPKNNFPKHAVDFRPISLCNTSYKVISKLLAARVKTILGKIITPFQTAFIAGRSITDNIVIAHELVDSMKKSKTKNGWMAMKLDMSKAFDRIE